MSGSVPKGSVDLTDCDREPIHQLGLIQPTGFLIAVSADWIVLHVSANIASWLGVEPEDLLGTPLARVIGGGGAAYHPGAGSRSPISTAASNGPSASG